VDNSDTIYDTLIERKQKALSAAHGTPFTVGPLAELVRAFGDAPGADAIRNGTYDPSNLEEFEEIKQWIRDVCHSPESGALPPISLTPATAEFRKIIKVVKEGKTLSPSGRHYGHYRAIIDREDILPLYSSMASLHFRYGFYVHRWAQLIDFMLEKDPGSPKIHRLRIIVLMEGDL